MALNTAALIGCVMCSQRRGAGSDLEEIIMYDRYLDEAFYWDDAHAPGYFLGADPYPTGSFLRWKRNLPSVAAVLYYQTHNARIQLLEDVLPTVVVKRAASFLSATPAIEKYISILVKMEKRHVCRMFRRTWGAWNQIQLRYASSR